MRIDDARAVVRELHHRAGRLRSLERLFTEPDGFGLTTPTPLQRAICRLIDGRDLQGLERHPHVRAAIGDVAPLVGHRPLEVVLLAGIRTAKSQLAAALAYRAIQTARIEHLGRGEIARLPVISIDRDKAAAVFGHFLGNVQASPSLSGTLLEVHEHHLRALVRHPNGRPIEFMVVAGKRAGGAVVSRWLVGLIFDEAPRMLGRLEGVVNLEDMRHAALGRMLDGAQIFYPGSPWAPLGPIYKMVKEHGGRPRKNAPLVIRAKGPWLNPIWWSKQRCAALAAHDSDAYRTDVLAEFLDRVEKLYPEALTAPCVRASPEHLPYEHGASYSAAIDPATRNNAWTLVVSTRKGALRRVAYAKQWQGSQSEPLRSRRVLKDIKKVLDIYRIEDLDTDQWSSDTLKDIAEEEGINLIEVRWTKEQNYDAFMNLREGFGEKLVEVPNNPQLLDDLRQVERSVTNKAVSIQLPEIAGRHCDYAPALARSMARYLDDIAVAPPPRGTTARDQYDEDQLEKEDDAEWMRRKREALEHRQMRAESAPVLTRYNLRAKTKGS